MFSTAVRTYLTRRSIHMTSAVRNEGATASSKGFGEKEKAVENQWARKHVSNCVRKTRKEKEREGEKGERLNKAYLQDAELLKKLRENLEQQEKQTAEIKKQLAELESKQKK